MLKQEQGNLSSFDLKICIKLQFLKFSGSLFHITAPL